MSGVPPTSGWKFYHESPCFRPNDIANVNTTGRLLLRAVMRSSANGQNVNPCFDSSPEFTTNPLAITNRGYASTYNNSGFDSDGDSLVYSWDRTYNPPTSNPFPLGFKNGYSTNIPFPDKNFDIRNVPAQLDPKSGIVEFGVYSGVGVQKYITVVKIDAYRAKTLLSSAYREVPTIIADVPNLPGRKLNSPPNFIFSGINSQNYKIKAKPGEKVSFPISIIDSDINPTQLLTLTMNGSHFSQDYTATGACYNSQHCAYLENSTPFLDTISAINKHSIVGNSQINTMFNWQTDCSLLGVNGQDKTYYFYLDVQDGFCPVPASKTAVIEITITNSKGVVRPELSCITASLFAAEVNWNQSVYNSINNFQNIEIYKSNTRNGIFSLLTSTADTNQTSYSRSFVHPTKYWYYIKINGLDCNNQAISSISDTLTNPDFQLAIENTQSCFNLTWENQYINNVGKYIIFREFPIGSGFLKIDSVYNDSTYCDPFNACSDSVKFKVRFENGVNCSYDLFPISSIGKNDSISKGITNTSRVLTASASFGHYQWFDCNTQSIIKDSIGRTLTPQETGIYAVILYQYGCSDTSDCVLFYPLSINENTLQSQLKFFPNPTSGLVQIQFAEKQNVLNVEVYSIEGKLVQRKKFQGRNSFELNLKQT